LSGAERHLSALSVSHFRGPLHQEVGDNRGRRFFLRVLVDLVLLLGRSGHILHHAPAEGVVAIHGEHLYRIRHLVGPVVLAVFETQTGAAAAVAGKRAGRAIGETARRGAVGDAQELVAVGGVAVGFRQIRCAAALPAAVAEGVVAVGERAVEPAGKGETVERVVLERLCREIIGAADVTVEGTGASCRKVEPL
jgi:hypothetical protein